MTIDGHPRPPRVEGSTLPYGKDPSATPSDSGTDRKTLRWRGAKPQPETSESGSWVAPAATESGSDWTAPPPASSPAGQSGNAWVGPAGREAFDAREPTPYPSLNDGKPGVELTLGWIEQVLHLSFGTSIDVRVAGVGKRWRIRLDEKQLVDILSSMAHYVRKATPDGGTMTVHAMPLTITPGENAARVGVAAGKYLYLGISHTSAAEGATTSVRPARARVGLDSCLRLVNELGGSLSVDRRDVGMMAMNIYLPALE